MTPRAKEVKREENKEVGLDLHSKALHHMKIKIRREKNLPIIIYFSRASNDI